MIRDDPAERTAGEPRRHDAAPPTSEAPAAPASLTTFVVDDEALARRQIADLVAQVPWARHAGEAADGAAGLAAIDVLRPDVLFLDVQMPEMSGLELAARLTYAPAVIFTTAHDRYAVTAFELEAVDYLLKPFGRRRFVAALERARRARAARPASDTRAADQACEGHEVPAARAEGDGRGDAGAMAGLLGQRLLVRDTSGIVPIPLGIVERIDAEDDYVAVVARGRRHLMAARLGDLAAQLPPDRFLRVHRSHIVNLDYVERLVPYDAKRLEVQMRDGARILASRASSEMIRRRAR